MLISKCLQYIVALSIFACCSGYNILFMGPFPAPSHWMWLEHFQRDLLRRGHHVTSVNNHPTKYPHPNLTEIIIDPKFDIPFYCKSINQSFTQILLTILNILISLLGLQFPKKTFLKCVLPATFKICKCGGMWAY